MWRRLFLAHSAYGGASWALGPVLMLPEASGMQAMLLISVVITVAAVVTLSISDQRAALLVFLVCLLLPPAVVATASGVGELQVAAAILAMVFAALAIVGIDSHRSLRTMLETQSRMRAILDNSLDAILGVDAQGRITDWNRRAETVFGWSREQALGMPIDTHIIPERFRENHRRGMAGFLASGEAGMMKRRIELSALRRNGAEFPIELVIVPEQQGERRHFTCFITDISERKATEASLLVLSRAVEQSPLSIVITDPDGSIRYVNPKFEAITGYSRAEAIGRNPRLLGSGDTPAEVYRNMWDTLLAGHTWQGEFHNRRKDGGLFWELASISPVVNDKGQLIHYVAVKEDFSERKANELALIEARESAERANRAKSEFLSSMSHELRTPMNAILGFAQILEIDEELGADQRECVREILQGGKHLLQLINDVLDLSRIESGRLTLSLEPVALAEVVADCLKLIQPLAGTRGIEPRVSVPASCKVMADRVRVKQAVLNLLSNAVKYNREGGQVALEAELAGGRVRIVVSDDGPGIAAERMAELFQPFSRLGAEFSVIEGTGIGLTITRRLVEMMHGTVGVESTVGSGSRFWVDLPASSADGIPAPDAVSPVQFAGNIDRLAQNILCIDDNPVNLKLIQLMLKKHRPFHIRTAHTAGLGLELARAQAPDLILLDINMPDTDGYQTLALLRADPTLRDIPVIAVTANAMTHDIERGMAAGFAAYLTKPLAHAQLVATVDKVLRVAPTRATEADHTL
jgi:PAS domain S-box-containing protein